MTKELQEFKQKTFKDIKYIDKNGIEYWKARELMHVLEYTNWRNFKVLINKVIESEKNSNINILEHFDASIKMVNAGVAYKKVEDYKLTRYACYLIVQNGSSKKNKLH